MENGTTLTIGTQPRTRRSLHYGWVVAALGILVLLGSQGLGRFGYTMILPGMKEGLQLSYAQAGLLAGINSAGYVLVSVWAGVIAARHGPRGIISVSLVFCGLAMFFLGLAPTFEVALAMQFLVGIATAFVSVPAMGMCTAWFAPRRRGLATGLVATGSGLGLVVAGVAVPVIIRAHPADWWRFAWVYFGLGVLGLAALAAVLLRDRPGPGQTRVGETISSPPAAIAAQPPVRVREVWTMPLVWYIGLLAGINTFSYVGFSTFFAAYLINERGLDPGTTGALWGLAGTLALVSGLVWGALSDRIGRGPALTLIYVTQIVCFTTFAFAPSLPGYLVAALLYGITARANFAVSAAAVGDLMGPTLAPAAFGLTAVAAGLGLTIGPIVAGPIADIAGSFKAVFLLGAAAAAIGALVSLRLRLPKTSL